MPAHPTFSVDIVEVVGYLLLTAIPAVAAYVGALWYWGLDRKTEAFDQELREEIEADDSFSGIRQSAKPDYVVTSDSNLSKSLSAVKVAVGRLVEKPDKIVVVDTDDPQERNIQMIRERTREIPGRNLLTSDLVGAIRNHFAYQLALSQEDISSGVVEHFKTAFEEYEHSGKVQTLAKPETYHEITLREIADSDETQDPLNDVFLELAQAAEMYCVSEISNTTDQRQEIERCQELLMSLFFSLWTQHAKGVRVPEHLPSDECLPLYRRTIRDEDNWGYWMLPMEECDEEEFERLRHLAWRIEDIVEEYWSDEIHSCLHPEADSIREMEFVGTPFVVFQKDEALFRGGGHNGPN